MGRIPQDVSVGLDQGHILCPPLFKCKYSGDDYSAKASVQPIWQHQVKVMLLLCIRVYVCLLKTGWTV
jgi:hypothetical protein